MSWGSLNDAINDRALLWHDTYVERLTILQRLKKPLLLAAAIVMLYWMFMVNATLEQLANVPLEGITSW